MRLAFPFKRLSASIENMFNTRAAQARGCIAQSIKAETTMKVSDILKLKGSTLFTVTPDTPLAEAAATMAAHDIGELVGMLTFREIILQLREGGGSLGTTLIRKVMDDHPITCTPETDVNEIRRMMLERHARYLPVLEKNTLMGVVSFYDVAKAVVEEQGFENRMLKAYIRDWPEEQEPASN
jgi:CBS domain-containing protein